MKHFVAVVIIFNATQSHPSAERNTTVDKMFLVRISNKNTNSSRSPHVVRYYHHHSYLAISFAWFIHAMLLPTTTKSSSKSFSENLPNVHVSKELVIQRMVIVKLGRKTS